MSVGLDPTRVEIAGPIMAEALGLSWTTDRLEVLEMLNDYRNLLYNMYPKLKLFNDVFHCMCVQTFPLKCTDVCSPDCQTYQGITLPSDVVALESAWYYNQPLKLRSRWREAHTGIGEGSNMRVELVEMAERFCTERPLTALTRLKMSAEDADDEDKVAVIDVLDAHGVSHTQEFTLKADAFAYSQIVVGAIISVRLPAELRGRVTLAQEDGHVLSIYSPGEVVPLYRRFRVASACPSGNILIQGVKRFLPMYCDSDIVEVGDRLVLKAAGSFLKYRENTTDNKEITRAEYDRTEMSEMLTGVIARHRGHAVQDNSAMRPRRISRTGLMPNYYRQ